MQSNIKVYANNAWFDALWYQVEAFKQYKLQNSISNTELIYNNYGYNFKIKRINGGIYLIRNDDTKMPICDWHDVKVFLVDSTPPNWYPARDYQTWSYFNFIYNNFSSEQKYHTIGSNDARIDEFSIKIPINGLDSNIIFNIYKNENGIVFYKRDDINRTIVRISDNNIERIEYFNYYNRMTQPLVDTVMIPSTVVNTITIPAIINITTSNESLMCTICNNYKKNIIFRPCNHNIVCSYCAKKIYESTKKLYCPVCRAIVTNINKIKPIDWFDAIFGFVEQDYLKTKSELLKLYMIGLQQSINEVNVGSFMLLNLDQLYTLCTIKYGVGNVKIKNIVADIKEINKSLNNNNATIQVASQLNCLEMINQNITPENGITCYHSDNTQGPICVMCTPTGLAYRNYIYNGGQNKDQQIDMTNELLTYFKSLNSDINWIVKNGYLIINNEQVLLIISQLLTDVEIRKCAKNKIKAGIHTGLGVFIDGEKYTHTVNHVLCSGLPISYHNYPLNNINLWDSLSELFLETYYEITLLTACTNNMLNNIDAPCYLTQLGGGAFGMKKSLITKAIRDACEKVRSMGHKLNVFIVHYGSIDPVYNL